MEHLMVRHVLGQVLEKEYIHAELLLQLADLQ
jgi:hypothetical protein